MSDPGLPDLTIDEASRLIATRRLSPVELVDATLARIRALEPALRCHVTVLEEQAMASAHLAESEIMRAGPKSPLHGIPFGLKDVYETAGVLTTAGSPLLRHHVPSSDAAAVKRLQEAGAILVGKHSTHEFAHGGPAYDTPWPNPANPWNTDHFTGGSSSGSAAAVAAGLCMLALGTDTGGSVRNPAAYCGVVGLKPTYGRVSKRGVITNAFSLDHCGPLTRTVADCALVLQAIAGHDPHDPSSANAAVPDYARALGAGLRGSRIGLVRHFHEEDSPCHVEQVGALTEASRVLESLGARVDDVRLSPLDHYSDVKLVISTAELFAAHAHDLRSRPDAYGSVFRFRAMVGALVGSSDYLLAQQHRRRLMHELDAVLTGFDALLLPCMAGAAPRLDAVDPMAYFARPSFTAPFNVTGHPAVSVRCGFSRSGLPLALQLVSSRFDEAGLLRIALAYERAAGWRDARPTLAATGQGPSRPPSTV